MLSISYLLLSVLIVILILFGYNSWNKCLVKAGEEKLKPTVFIIPFLIWIIYITALSFTDILQDYSIPPRFAIFIFLPLASLMIIFYWSNKNNAAFGYLPLSWTTYFHSFRIAVEILLLYTFYEGILPESATFEGYNFDILMGITAIIMGYLISRNLNKYKRLLLIWNIVGILMILIVVFVVATSVYLPALWNSTVPLVSREFFRFPYFFLPGVLAPAAIFMHVVSLVQLRNR